MSQATAAASPMSIPQPAERNKDTSRHILPLDFILSPTSRRFCTAGGVRNDLQRPITHLTAEREISSYQFSLAVFFFFFKGDTNKTCALSCHSTVFSTE